MKHWQENLLGIIDGVQCEHVVFKKIEAAAQALGFEHCAFGLRIAQSFSRPKTIILNNYAAPWWVRYVNEGYLHTDSTVLYRHRARTSLNWSDKVSGLAHQLRGEAQNYGLHVGWTQSNLNALGLAGMLTLSRSHETPSGVELASQKMELRWLVNAAHLALSRIFLSKLRKQLPGALTSREIEVLRWTADGKTSAEVSDILAVSENTVNFHVKNAVAKLQTSNKTAAVARAAMLGILS